MKKVMLGALALMFMAGCATQGRHNSGSLTVAEKRRLSMKQCVKDMIEADSSPSDALSICEVVYERWDSTIKR